MSIGDDELESLTGKKIIIQYWDVAGVFSNIEATLLAHTRSGKAILVRQTDESQPQTIYLDRIELVELAGSGRARKVTARTLAPAAESNVNSHLADRHGYFVSVVNEIPVEMAMRLHGKIEHEDLGHAHTE